MEQQKIKPTVGRIVHWYRPESMATQKWTESGIEIFGEEWKEPVAAIITKTFSSDDNRCRLQILDPWTRHNYSAYLVYSEEPKPNHWSWPPRV